MVRAAIGIYRFHERSITDMITQDISINDVTTCRV